MMLRFDFNQQCYRFSEPVTVVQTRQNDEVLACLQQVEQWVAQGYYAVGYLAYEAAPAFRADYAVPPANNLPLLWFAIVKQPDLSTPLDDALQQPFMGNWQANVNQEQYQQAIEQIRQQIAEGNTYQTNYTIRLKANFGDHDAYRFYLQLLQAQRANYSAFLSCDEFAILSASPELFFHWQDQQITTKPMKGTSARGLMLEDDRQQGQALFTEKNQAENMMIVDLLRNDLSQIAQPGSVKVSKLFEAEKYPTVWQLTSTITAQTKAGVNLRDIFTALFPCGSITGAPKKSTMQLITELEPQARGVYCGAIGMITPQHEAIFNVPIRTVVIDRQKQQAEYGVGGGITWDSEVRDEFQEVQNKAQVLQKNHYPKQLLESLLLKDGEFWLLDLHLQRLQSSAEYFAFHYPQVELQALLQQLAQNYPTGQFKVRLLLSANGEISYQCEALQTVKPALTASWAEHSVNSQNRLLYHKTTARQHLPTISWPHEQLLFNERDEITEFVNGNVVLCINNEWLTPKLACGLLPGTLRQQLLTQGKIREAVLSKADLNRASNIVFINSVRGWCEVSWLD